MRQKRKKVSIGKEIRIKVGNRYLKQPKYWLEKNPTTGLLVRKPRLRENDLRFYYKNNDWTIHCFKELFPTEKTLRKPLLSQLRSAARVLDIGCGDGRFLASLPSDIKKYGIELSAGAAKEAEKKGITILSEKKLKKNYQKRFQAILLLDVFEHLKQPERFIKKYLRYLAPNGVLAISTGDGDYCLSQKDPANFWYWRIPVHLCMITKHFIWWLQRNTGLQLIFEKRLSHYPIDIRLFLRQKIQKIMFDLWNRNNPESLKKIMRRTPLLQKAQHWEYRPVFWYGKDHVVLLFKYRTRTALSQR